MFKVGLSIWEFGVKVLLARKRSRIDNGLALMEFQFQKSVSGATYRFILHIIRRLLAGFLEFRGVDGINFQPAVVLRFFESGHRRRATDNSAFDKRSEKRLALEQFIRRLRCIFSGRFFPYHE